MKSILLISLIITCLLFNAINAGKKNVRQSVVTESSSTTTVSAPKKPKLLKPDMGDIWNDLFTVPRTSSCKAEENAQKILAEVRADEARKYSGADILINDSAFAWIKKWGFGPIAYLFDFWDPLFRSEVLKEFNQIHNSTMHEDPENTPEYKDPFDYAGKIANAAPEQQDSLMRELKKFERSYDPVIYKVSANAVQVMKAMRKFSWFIDPGQADFASDFVTRFDINHDGRLSPRELILGAIIYNKGILGSKKCNHCFSQISRRIGALFSYLDCGETGFISADQMWKGLPELRRPTQQFNIFGYGNSENIRTNAINDFVLKNENAKDAAVSKEEFVAGILLGIWDRQVSDNAIIDDDSRNLKRLRWSQNNMVDTAAYNYVKAITKAKIEEEEKERYARWEKERLRKAEKAKELWDQQQASSGN